MATQASKDKTSITTLLDDKPRATLCLAYGVFGLSAETSAWEISNAVTAEKVETTSKAPDRLKFKPEILGSSPKHGAADPAMAKLLHMALHASCPNDLEIALGAIQPACMNHSFALQRSSQSTLYGVALLVFMKADDKRAKEIENLYAQQDVTITDGHTSHWIPYVLCFISEYPLFNLLGTYIRAMWIHWSKGTNLFQAEEVSRVLAFPAPRMESLVQVDMQEYALAYRFPSNSSAFQNFDMWPLFACLSIPKVVVILEAVLSLKGRIILTTAYPAMLNIAAETLIYACRGYDWTGLYVPVCHCSSVKKLVEESGPYILGVTQDCRSLFRAPLDAVVVNLDLGSIETCYPPVVFSKPSTRQKFIRKLTEAVGYLDSWAVPVHLRSAYSGDKLLLEGQVINAKSRVEIVTNPVWWNQDAVLAACDHVCSKLRKNRGLKKLTSGTKKKTAMAKISARSLQTIEHDNAMNARDLKQAWINYCALETRMGLENSKLTKRNEFLMDELAKWASQFEKFQLIAQHLTKQSLDLNAKMQNYKTENERLTQTIKGFVSESRKLELSRDAAIKGQEDLVKEKKHLQAKLRAMETQNSVLSQQRDAIESVLQTLRQLIQTQPDDVVKVLERHGTVEERILSPQEAHKRIHAVSRTSLLSQTSRRCIEGDRELKRSSHDMGNKVSSVRVAQKDVKTTTEFEQALGLHGQSRDLPYDPAYSAIREQTQSMTNLFSKITADCLAAIAQINNGEDFEI